MQAWQLLLWMSCCVIDNFAQSKNARHLAHLDRIIVGVFLFFLAPTWCCCCGLNLNLIFPPSWKEISLFHAHLLLLNLQQWCNSLMVQVAWSLQRQSFGNSDCKTSSTTIPHVWGEICALWSWSGEARNFSVTLVCSSHFWWHTLGYIAFASGVWSDLNSGCNALL